MPRIIFFGKSDIGMKRSNNEDSFVIKPRLGFAVVADGMGGPASGEVASSIFAGTAVEIFSGHVNQAEKLTVVSGSAATGNTPDDGFEYSGRSVESTVKLVQDVFERANEKIFNTASQNRRHSGMGCTAEIAAFYDHSYVIGHVGDSRTYLFREGLLTQITRDHSVVQDQLDQGLISPEDARIHSLRHVILKAVGVRETVSVDIVKGTCQPGDILLLCSDGLTDMVEDDPIKGVLLLPLDLEEKVDRLIGLAKAAGGNDNITVALCACT